MLDSLMTPHEAQTQERTECSVLMASQARRPARRTAAVSTYSMKTIANTLLTKPARVDP